MDQLEHLDIALTSEEMDAVREQVASGNYASPSDVVRAALKALVQDEQEHAERLAGIKRKIADALNDPRPPLTMDEARARMAKRFREAEQKELQARRNGSA